MEFTTLNKAISDIGDGSFITFSGMELNRAPMALIYEIVKQGKKNLKTVSIPNPIATDVLVSGGCVKYATFGFNGFSFERGFVIAPNWRSAIEKGTIQWKETDMLEIVLALKAGAEELKEIEIPYLSNTDYLKFNNYRKDGKRIFTNALNPDFALIHAQYADKDGNVFIEDPLIDNLIVSASKNVIVSVEKIVDKLEKITIQKEKIKSIVEIKSGALPTSCFKFYNYDLNKIKEFAEKSKKENNKIKTQTNQNYIDYMIITIAEIIENGASFATGVASPIPMIAAMFAKESGKDFDYFNCGSGAINPELKEPAYSSVTINALEKKESFIELQEVWDYALRGKIDLMCFGAVQIAKNGDVNMTCIGDYKKPKVKLPGPAGAVTLRNLCKNTVIISTRHNKKTFVEEVDFITSHSKKDSIVVTNLGILRLGEKSEILSVFPHSSIEEIKNNTGFELEDKNAKKHNIISEKEFKLLNKICSQEIRANLA